MLLPLKLMWDRVDLARADSDTTLFLHLLYAGEFATKFVTAGMLAAVADDRERHRYRLAHRLLRADGLGDWAAVLDEILFGPASHHVVEAAAQDRRALNERLGPGAWQHEAVSCLSDVVAELVPDIERTPNRVSASRWFTNFAVLRNKTRGHGAITPEGCARLAPRLQHSVSLILENVPVLKRRWAYLHRNLSGKYRIVPLQDGESPFKDLKTSAYLSAERPANLPDGIYIEFGDPMQVELVETSVDVRDFFLPNGAFKGKSFEWLSLISDSRKNGDASAYMAPPGERPVSETDGQRLLDATGKAMSNLPPAPQDYVPRPELEAELLKALKNDRHPVITLVGRGGIGKTSLALTALHRAASEGYFELIVWFSARDIDLQPSGPKVVAPRVLSESDVAKEFVRLVEPTERHEQKFKAGGYLERQFAKSDFGPALYVFDNFETVRNPGDLFAWMDTHIRLPNKILITTRHREFKADFPIEVSGMNSTEADQLVDSVAARLGITQLLTKSYRSQIFDEADGHPYIVKVLLGEVARAGRLINVERVVAGNDDILDALFERTFAGLEPASRRVFLTLCAWRSLVPQVALEAVLLRPANEKMDVARAVDDLVQCSFVERSIAPDSSVFLDVALVAAVFGRRKLEVSSMKMAIDADVEFLNQIGAITGTGLRHGVRPRIERLFESLARRISLGRIALVDVKPSLEYVARQFPPAWLMLAKLHEEAGGETGLTDAAESVRRFLEVARSGADQKAGWDELARLSEDLGDLSGALQATIRSAMRAGADFVDLSYAANWVNNLLRQASVDIDSQEKRLLIRELAGSIAGRIDEGDATDRSRLAWLYLHLGEPRLALEHAERGLALDRENDHCARLVDRLTKQGSARKARD